MERNGRKSEAVAFELDCEGFVVTPEPRVYLAAAAKAESKDYYIEQEPPFISMTGMEAVGVDYRYLRAI